MKPYLRGLNILIIVILIILILLREKRGLSPSSPIPLLEWGIQGMYYSKKSSRGFGDEFNLEVKGGKALLTITRYEVRLMNINSKEHLSYSGILEKDHYSEKFMLDPKKVQTIEEILKKYEARKRAGSYNNPQVLDGDSRSFSVYYWNGESIRADGYNNSPQKFWEGMNEILALFNEEYSKVQEKVDTLLEQNK